MAWKPSLSDLLIINRPYNWLEHRFVKDKERFYAPERRKYGYLAGAFLYAGFAISGCKMYQNLNDDWHYADLSPTITLARYSMAAQEEDAAKTNAKIRWGALALFNFWAGDFAFMYAARNRKYHKERGENREKSGEIPRLTR